MLCVSDFEKYASEHMESLSWAFIASGSEKEQTLQENIEAFKRYWFIPRMLRIVGNRDLSVRVLGEKLSIPIGLAPTAHQKIAHPNGEIAAAKAAASMGTIYTMSTFANTSLEDLSHDVPDCIRWIQVYILADRSITARMIQRAENQGFKALVWTVDGPVAGTRYKQKYCVLPEDLTVPNVSESLDPEKPWLLSSLTNSVLSELSWKDLEWLKTISKLPIVLKGISTAADAKLAVEYGAAAVWVSNHGGRQLDGTRATIDVLEDVAEALKGTTCEVYVDGGIRWGSDILKALALGARAVFIGRPLLWGLCHSGEDGVRKVLEILKEELITAMALSGCRDFSDVGSSLIQRNPSSLTTRCCHQCICSGKRN